MKRNPKFVIKMRVQVDDGAPFVNVLTLTLRHGCVLDDAIKIARALHPKADIESVNGMPIDPCTTPAATVQPAAPQRLGGETAVESSLAEAQRRGGGK
jgi:hypothetical protein